jgi:predicted Zn finger-like uncharacterized protein
MSLATRCVACGTVFRVVQDQLKVSEGWVRCGRCGSVFSALEGLFDLEREAAPSWSPSQQSGPDLVPANAEERAVQTALPAAHASRRKGSDGIDRDREAAVVSEGSYDDEDSRGEAQIGTQRLQRGNSDDDAVGRGEASGFDDPPTDDAGPAPAAPEPTPGFLRRADSAARWQRPGIRWALALAATVLALLLAMQVVVLQRDTIATRWPQATPLLVLLCEPLACSIDPLRRLDGLIVESSGLTQLDNPSLYRLQVLLRNRDTAALAAPALDLTLTDSRGEVLARRVIGTNEIGDTVPAAVPAGSELSLQAVLDAGDRRITGYSVEIFYP